MTRNGKIARLPKAVRDTLNRRLREGEPGKRLVAWLNLLPEVQAVLAAEFAGRPITENNLSEWKTGGYREWELHQEALARARSLAEHAEELRESAVALADHLAVALSVRYAAALAEWDRNPEAGSGKELRVLRALCADVVELRRGDHSAARLKLEQERREAEREETEEEAVEHFQRWAKHPRVRAVICGCEMTAEEKERRIREIFGLIPEPAPMTGGGCPPDPSATPARETEENPPDCVRAVRPVTSGASGTPPRFPAEAGDEGRGEDGCPQGVPSLRLSPDSGLMGRATVLDDKGVRRF